MATAQPSRPRGDAVRTGLHALFSIFATLIGLLVLAYAILWITKGRFLKPYFERIASHQAHRAVRVGGDFQLYLNPNIHFLAQGLSVANPAWAAHPQLFTGRSIEFELFTLRLIFGERRFAYLAVDGGDAALEWNKARQNSWTFGPDTGGPTILPAIERLGITDTRLSYADPALALKIGVRVGDIAGAHSKVDGAIGFAGRGTAQGKPFTLNGKLLAPNATIAGGRNPIVLSVITGDSHLDVSGTLPGATVLEGADLKIHAKGKDANTLLALLAVHALATRSYNLYADLTKMGIEWRFTRIHGGFGDSDLAGRLTLSLPNSRLLATGDLTSKKLDILDVGPWIGYDPDALTAHKGVIRTIAGTPRIIPDASLASESLNVFDARIRYRAAAIRTGSLPLSHLDMGVNLDHRLLKLQPLDFSVADGRFTGSVILNARRNPVVTDYDFHLGAVPLQKMLASFHTAAGGTTGTIRARLKLRGYGDTMRKSLATSSGRMAVIVPNGTLALGASELVELNAGRFAESFLNKTLKKPSTIRCGLIAFTVRSGQATADPILIDTDRSAIHGTGGFSFANESLNLKIKADSKRFSLFSAQSPIGVGGYFAKTTINPISKSLLARAGASIALGVVATPFAAILPFIDIGDAKSSNCGPMLRGAPAADQRVLSKQDAKAEKKEAKAERKAAKREAKAAR